VAHGNGKQRLNDCVPDRVSPRPGSAFRVPARVVAAPAARDDAQERFVAGDAVGFVDDEIVAWGTPAQTVAETMRSLAEGSELLTVVCGDGAPVPLDELPAHAPEGLELELHDGGQPHYWWLLAAE